MSHPDETDLTLIERVLLAVDLIPSGRVVSYGDLAELCGTSARRVGAILRDHGAPVAWWRVCSASGDHPLIERAAEYWHREGIYLKQSGRGCSMPTFKADLAALATAYEQALKESAVTAS